MGGENVRVLSDIAVVRAPTAATVMSNQRPTPIAGPGALKTPARMSGRVNLPSRRSPPRGLPEVSARPAGPRAFGAGSPAGVGLDASQHEPPESIGGIGVDPLTEPQTDWAGGRGDVAVGVVGWGGVFGHGPLFGGLQGAQAEYVRVPFSDVTLQPVPEGLAGRWPQRHDPI